MRRIGLFFCRFFAIHCPIKYAQTRNLTLVLGMIAAAWIISAVISIPPLVGWNDMSKDPNECGYVSEKGYVIYSSMGSFYIPLTILITVYLTIFLSARKRLRRRAAVAGPYGMTTVKVTTQGEDPHNSHAARLFLSNLVLAQNRGPWSLRINPTPTDPQSGLRAALSSTPAPSHRANSAVMRQRNIGVITGGSLFSPPKATARPAGGSSLKCSERPPWLPRVFR